MKPRTFPVITILIILVNIAFFIWQQSQKFGDEPLSGTELYLQGANVAQLSLTGDYWRLLKATVLHHDLAHLLMNMGFLLIFGWIAEAMLGWILYVIVYMGSGIFSSFFSAEWHFNDRVSDLYQAFYHTGPIIKIIISAGASGAIYGVAGALIRLYIVHNDSRELTFDIKKFIGLVIPLFGYSLMDKGIDNSAHLGGFIFGALFTLPAAFYALKSCTRSTYIISQALVASLFVGLMAYSLRIHYQDAESQEIRDTVVHQLNQQVEEFNAENQATSDLQKAILQQ